MIDPTDLQPWETHPEDPRINDPDLAAAMERITRQAKVKEFEKKQAKEMLDWARLPEHVKQVEAGDYHYNSWDMEPAEG